MGGNEAKIVTLGQNITIGQKVKIGQNVTVGQKIKFGQIIPKQTGLNSHDNTLLVFIHCRNG